MTRWSGYSLPGPPHDDHGSTFPEDALTFETAVFRICGRERSPWWFCSDGKCRFDLPPQTGGTCYLATEFVVALDAGWAHAPAQEIDLGMLGSLERAMAIWVRNRPSLAELRLEP